VSLALRQCKQPDLERLRYCPAGPTSVVDAQAARWLETIAPDLAAAL
jgi:hypothetical protein